ncbi:MAG: 3'-5' exonuclease [Bdellovibrionales bacterium]
MATLITPIKDHMMPGERRFVERLKDKLGPSCFCWFDVRLKPTRHPDYIVFDPQHGVWTLEVKDWKAQSIVNATPQYVLLRNAAGGCRAHNPLEQARTNALTVVDLLKTDPLLTDSQTGKLLFPWTYGCVLSNITRRLFEHNGLDKVIDSSRVICRDEMTETVDPEEFYARLLAMQPFNPPRSVSSEQIDRVRAHIFPEIRVGNQSSFFDAGLLETSQDIKVMDLHQERLARSLGDGHRIIHGVAGSGKTMILIYRALQLAEFIEKPIAVLCYNWQIAQHIKKTIEVRGAQDKVYVTHFHEWCRYLLREAGLEDYIPMGRDKADELVERTIRAVVEGQIEKGTYGAIMIDEGHDFREHPSWFNLVTDMLDPDPKSSLVIAYDDAQSIYDRKKEKKFSFKSVGINAQGRTTILKKNYRNTKEILELARGFSGHLLDDKGGDEDSAPTLSPECVGRNGEEPEIVRLGNFEEEASYIADSILNAEKNGLLWKDMAVIYRTSYFQGIVVKELKKKKIPFWQKGDFQNGYDPEENTVKLTTMHASKGLEFPFVCIIGLGAMPDEKRDEDEEARLLYVAMTRATSHLVVTYSHISAFVERLLAAEDKGQGKFL